MRYVRAALATASDGSTFLVEECIDEAREGPFRKYINNRSPVPVEFPDVANQNRCLFLAFAQHWQYNRTHGLTFVSDFQGKYSFIL